MQQTDAAAPPVLLDADELEAAGRPLDAIRLLTDANRRERNVALERRLVMLRHTAFETISRSPRPDLASPVPPAVYPPPPLVELASDELTPESRRMGFARNGCVLVRGLVPEHKAVELAR